jgi:hypothetical protein
MPMTFENEKRTSDEVAKCESTKQSPQSSSDTWESFTPPQSVRVVYKGATYVGMVTGIILALPFMAVASAKKWYEKSKGKTDE